MNYLTRDDGTKMPIGQHLDRTETARRALVDDMPEQIKQEVALGGRIWTTVELQLDFEVLDFLAPFVVVRRKSDGMTGTLMFTHSPRYYFGWADENGKRDTNQ